MVCLVWLCDDNVLYDLCYVLYECEGMEGLVLCSCVYNMVV